MGGHLQIHSRQPISDDSKTSQYSLDSLQHINMLCIICSCMFGMCPSKSNNIACNATGSSRELLDMVDGWHIKQEYGTEAPVSPICAELENPVCISTSCRDSKLHGVAEKNWLRLTTRADALACDLPHSGSIFVPADIRWAVTCTMVSVGDTTYFAHVLRVNLCACQRPTPLDVRRWLRALALAVVPLSLASQAEVLLVKI
jgi:hypothetical protein